MKLLLIVVLFFAFSDAAWKQKLNFWPFTKIFYCDHNECCDKRWVMDGFSKTLRNKVSQKLYGQQIAEQVVYNAIDIRLKEKDHRKALVMSFQGTAGIGKTYFSELLVGEMFKKGMQSQYARQIIVTQAFPYPEEVKKYQQNLNNWIIDNISACPKTIFIFDEFDKMPTALIDTITPFLGNYINVGGVDPRQSTFIFVHNTGGDRILKRTLELYAQNLKRTDFQLYHFESIVKDAANHEGPLKNSQLIKKSLIDHYVPFLPLEEEHLKKCIRDYTNEKRMSSLNARQVNCVLSYITFEEDLFSNSGCRQIEEKVRLVLQNPKAECDRSKVKEQEEMPKPILISPHEPKDQATAPKHPNLEKLLEHWPEISIALGIVFGTIFTMRCLTKRTCQKDRDLDALFDDKTNQHDDRGSEYPINPADETPKVDDEEDSSVGSSTSKIEPEETRTGPGMMPEFLKSLEEPQQAPEEEEPQLPGTSQDDGVLSYEGQSLVGSRKSSITSEFFKVPSSTHEVEMTPDEDLTQEQLYDMLSSTTSIE